MTILPSDAPRAYSNALETNLRRLAWMKARGWIDRRTVIRNGEYVPQSEPAHVLQVVI